jgi:hypothetical protein
MDSSGEERQRQGCDRDAQGQQRRDGVADMGGALARRSAAVPNPLAAQGPGQQELAAGVVGWCLGLGGEQPEHHPLGQENRDQKRGKGTGPDPPVGRPVALAKPEHPEDPGQGQIADGEGGQQSAHAASIAGLLVPHTLAAVEASGDA